MLRSSRLLPLFRQATVHEGILSSAPLRRTYATQSTTLSRNVCTPLRHKRIEPSVRHTNLAQVSRSWRTSPFRRSGQARHNSSGPSNHESSSPTQQSLSARMKEMSKKYGWVVVGLYLGLSALDFPFCFLAVRLFGTERIAAAEHAIMEQFWGMAEKVIPSLKQRRELKQALEHAADDATREGDGAGVVEAGKTKHEDASKFWYLSIWYLFKLTIFVKGIWTQLLLAYGVHKSLMFIRIPVTLAITPRVVKTLRKWGWNIGKAKPT